MDQKARERIEQAVEKARDQFKGRPVESAGECIIAGELAGIREALTIIASYKEKKSENMVELPAIFNIE